MIYGINNTLLTSLYFNASFSELSFKRPPRGKLDAVDPKAFCCLYEFSYIINKNGFVRFELNFPKDVFKHSRIRLPMAHAVRRKALGKVAHQTKSFPHVLEMKFVRIRNEIKRILPFQFNEEFFHLRILCKNVVPKIDEGSIIQFFGRKALNDFTVELF